MILYRKFYRAALITVRQWHQRYEDDVDDWYRNGDGRPSSEGGRGYRYPECIHGMSLWTDYDNICGGCEASLTVYQEAQGLAREWYDAWCNRYAFMSSAPLDVPDDVREKLAVWVLETLKPLDVLQPTG